MVTSSDVSCCKKLIESDDQYHIIDKNSSTMVCMYVCIDCDNVEKVCRERERERKREREAEKHLLEV